jgi:hypothetical protein
MTSKVFLNTAVEQGHLSNILEEIIIQSKIEFNYEEEDEEDGE